MKTDESIPQDQHDKLCRAVEGALNALEERPEHHRAAAGAVPPWLGMIVTQAVQVFGPVLIKALQDYLDSLNPRPAPQPSNEPGA